MRRLSLLLVIVALVLTSSAVASEVQATPQYESDVEYDAVTSGSQELTTTVELTSETISSDVSISFHSTGDAIIDHGSLDESVPGDVEIESTPRGYEIEELRPGQVVTIEFNAYPRETGEEAIDVARVTLDSSQQPSSETDTITEDISEDSAWFALQESINERSEIQEEHNRELVELENEKDEEIAIREGQIDDLESTIDDRESTIDDMRLMTYSGIIVGILGVLGTAGMYFWRERRHDTIKSNIGYELDGLGSDLEDISGKDSAAYEDYETRRKELQKKHDIPYHGTTSGFDNADNDSPATGFESSENSESGDGGFNDEGFDEEGFGDEFEDDVDEFKNDGL